MPNTGTDLHQRFLQEFLVFPFTSRFWFGNLYFCIVRGRGQDAFIFFQLSQHRFQKDQPSLITVCRQLYWEALLCGGLGLGTLLPWWCAVICARPCSPVLWGVCLELELCGRVADPVSDVLRPRSTLSHFACTILHSRQHRTGVPISLHPRQHSLLPGVTLPRGCGVASRGVLVFIWLMILINSHQWQFVFSSLATNWHPGNQCQIQGH